MATPIKSDLILTIYFDADTTWEQAESLLDRISEIANHNNITMVARLDEEPVFANEVGDAEQKR